MRHAVSAAGAGSQAMVAMTFFLAMRLRPGPKEAAEMRLALRAAKPVL